MQNIFKFAKKELSQDAVITCILSEKNDNAKGFLKDLIIKNPLFKDDIPQFISNSDFVLEDIKQQYNSIDVFCVISQNNDKSKKYAVIIEDKTDSSIHDNQVIRYVYNVAKDGSYEGIFFILVKTGAQDFWEPYDYELEARSLKKGTLAEDLSVSEKSREKIDDQVNEVRKYIRNVFFSSYNRVNFLDFLKSNTWEYSWMTEYITFLDSKASKSNWSDKQINVKEFKERLAGSDLISKKLHCAIYRPRGSGRRDPDVAVEGFYFEKGTIKYCLLPGMTLRDNAADFFLHFHVYMDSSNKQGYADLKTVEKKLGESDFVDYKKERENMIEKATRELKGWTMEKKDFCKTSYLNICKKRVEFKEDDPSTNTKVREAFQQIIAFSENVREESNRITSCQ